MNSAYRTPDGGDLMIAEQRNICRHGHAVMRLLRRPAAQLAAWSLRSGAPTTRAEIAVLVALSFTFALLPFTADAGVCPVPSPSHPTIQAAVDDASCSEIYLSAGIFTQSISVGRDLSLHGASSSSTVILGHVVVDGDTTEVSIQDLRIDAGGSGAAEALEVRGGATVNGVNLDVVNGSKSTVIFHSGFESGTSEDWSGVVPSEAGVP
jgi:hypothetical protein